MFIFLFPDIFCLEVDVVWRQHIEKLRSKDSKGIMRYFIFGKMTFFF